MALFNATALREGSKPHPVDIRLGHIVEKGKELPVILTLNMSNKLMKVFVEADDLYHASPRLPVLSRREIKRRKRKNIQSEAKLVSDHVAFCKAILEAGYLNSQNIVDDPSLEAIIMAIEQEPGFAENLAMSLNYYFKGQDKFAFIGEEETEKN